MSSKQCQFQVGTKRCKKFTSSLFCSNHKGRNAIQCSFIITAGPKKGNQCESLVAIGSISYCSKHLRSNTYSSTTARDTLLNIQFNKAPKDDIQQAFVQYVLVPIGMNIQLCSEIDEPARIKTAEPSIRAAGFQLYEPTGSAKQATEDRGTFRPTELKCEVIRDHHRFAPPIPKCEEHNHTKEKCDTNEHVRACDLLLGDESDNISSGDSESDNDNTYIYQDEELNGRNDKDASDCLNNQEKCPSYVLKMGNHPILSIPDIE